MGWYRDWLFQDSLDKGWQWALYVDRVGNVCQQTKGQRSCREPACLRWRRAIERGKKRYFTQRTNFALNRLLAVKRHYHHLARWELTRFSAFLPREPRSSKCLVQSLFPERNPSLSQSRRASDWWSQPLGWIRGRPVRWIAYASRREPLGHSAITYGVRCLPPSKNHLKHTKDCTRFLSPWI